VDEGGGGGGGEVRVESYSTEQNLKKMGVLLESCKTGFLLLASYP